MNWFIEHIFKVEKQVSFLSQDKIKGILYTWLEMKSHIEVIWDFWPRIWKEIINISLGLFIKLAIL